MKTPGGIIVLLILSWPQALLSLPCHRAEYQIGQECCPMCDPGTRVSKHCTDLRSTSCVLCEDGTYMDEPSGRTQCFRCRICSGSAGLRVKASCSSRSNAICEPQDGFFCEEPLREGNCEAAKRHKSCEPGQFIQTPGSSLVDTECLRCPNGTFSNGTLRICQPHSQCQENQVELKAGTLQSDRECGQRSVAPIIIGVVLGALAVVGAGVAFMIYKKKKNSVI